MHIVRHHLQRLAWIALVAVLGLALAPTVSHALNAGGASNPWSEICSTGGTTPAPADSGHARHCPLCGQPGDMLGMPPAGEAVAAVPAGGVFVAQLPGAAPRTLRVWSAAQPGAPPASS